MTQRKRAVRSSRGVCASAEDLASFIDALLSGRLLGPESLELLEIRHLERVEVHRGREQPLVDRLADHLGAEPFEVDHLGEVLQLAGSGREAVVRIVADQEFGVALARARDGASTRGARLTRAP